MNFLALYINIYFLNVYEFFSSRNSKLVYTFESLSLELRQGSRVIHFTTLAPMCHFVVGNKDFIIMESIGV
jgi:hypothetical protein